MLIRTANLLDMPSVAQLHHAAFGNTRDHLTATLPLRELAEYYATVLRQNRYSYIAFDAAQQPIGFICGGLNTSASVRAFTREHKYALAKALLMHPRLLAVRFASILRDRVESRVPLRLFSIAVDPSHQGQGTGKALLRHYEQQLQKEGAREYGLSVKLNNRQAMHFYDANGFDVEFQTSRARYYIKTLSGLAAQSQ